MKHSQLASLALALAGLAPTAQARVPFIAEIYASQIGVDDQEFIELDVDPLASLDGFVVVVVDGSSGSATQGRLLAAWDLSGFATPADGYFVLGTAAVAGVDLVIGSNDVLPDRTATYMVVSSLAPGAVVAQVGNLVDPELDGNTTLTILGSACDRVTLADAGIDSGDLSFDGSGWVGPNAGALPAGIFRSSGFDQSWCNSAFLDPDAAVNLAAPRTPGSANVTCGGALDSATYCTAGTSIHGCQVKVWSAGVPSATAGRGFHLYAGSLDSKGTTAQGIFFYGVNGRSANQWGNGTSYFCLNGPVMRGELLGQSTVGCNGLFNWDLNARFAAKPAQNPGPGTVMQAQLWYRDPRNTSNTPTSLSNAIEFTVQ